MAVAEVGTIQATTTASEVTSTISYALDGAATFLLVRIAWAGASSHTVSTVTWNTTEVCTIGQTGSAVRGVALAYLKAPTTGTANLVIVRSGTISSVQRVHMQGFSGVDQTTPVGTIQTATSSGAGITSITVTVTTASGEHIIDQLLLRTNRTEAVGADQTSEWNDNDLPEATRSNAGSYQAGASGGVMSWSWTGGDSDCWLAAIPIIPTAAAGGAVGPLVGGKLVGRSILLGRLIA